MLMDTLVKESYRSYEAQLSHDSNAAATSRAGRGFPGGEKPLDAGDSASRNDYSPRAGSRVRPWSGYRL